jgi:hypothetical protein
VLKWDRKKRKEKNFSNRDNFQPKDAAKDESIFNSSGSVNIYQNGRTNHKQSTCECVSTQRKRV